MTTNPPAGPAFSIQSTATTFFTLSTFSGKYLYPNSVNRNALDITFSESISSISVIFATIDTLDPEVPSILELTASLNSVPVGAPSTQHSTFLPGETYPQATLSFDGNGEVFNSVRLIVPFQPIGATTFMIDDVTVMTAGSSAVPEPQTAALSGIAVVGLLALSRRSRGWQRSLLG